MTAPNSINNHSAVFTREFGIYTALFQCL